MKLFKKIINITMLFSIAFFGCLIITRPDLCRNGAFKGILICGRIVIPNLYPFTVCVLFLTNSGALSFKNESSRLINAVFRISNEQAVIFLLSLVGGYPVGAKIIDRYVTEGRFSKKQGRVMLNYSINGGPAFIIGAVGVGVFGNRKLGYIIFASHILASVIICFICRFYKTENIKIRASKKTVSAADNFVISSADAAATVLNISAFVILFSAINEYIKEFSEFIPSLKLLGLVSEVTNGVTEANNVLMVSFLLGFSGICIWFQVISALKSFKPKLFTFVFFRFLHGFLSVCITSAMLKIFKISVETINLNGFDLRPLSSTPALAVSMGIMCLLFMISLNRKKYSRKLLEDMVY